MTDRNKKQEKTPKWDSTVRNEHFQDKESTFINNVKIVMNHDSSKLSKWKDTEDFSNLPQWMPDFKKNI